MNVIPLMAIHTSHAIGDMNIKGIAAPAEFESDFFPGMTGQAGLGISGFFQTVRTFVTLLFGMASFAGFDVAIFTVQFHVGDTGNIHKSAVFFIPVSHALTCMVQTVVKTGFFFFSGIKNIHQSHR
jgi:hypothetical protein